MLDSLNHSRHSSALGRKRLLSSAVLILLAVLGGAGVASRALDQGLVESANSESVSRDFRLSADPAVRLLAIVYRGVTTGRETHLSLFGDGRFVAEMKDHHGGLLRRGETSLPYAEVRSVMELVVSHGIADVDGPSVMRKIEASGSAGKEARFLPSDAGTVMITLKLEEYLRDGEVLKDHSASVLLGEPKILARLAPGVAEVRGFVEVSARLRPLRQQLLEGEHP
ncbi:MAG: hypothetical protein AAF604_23250 [Acidobacteriota bacterium]